MKYIVKQNEPAEFKNWKELKNDDWTPTYDKLQGAEKQSVLKGLKEEHGYICCYCEGSIDVDDCHIEHLKPQAKSLYPQNQLDYDNLLCSCQLELSQGEPRHCGNSKGNWYDEELLISPLQQGCEGKFKFTFDGYILPTDPEDVSAITTIDKLHLGIRKLNAKRLKAIEPFLYEDLSSNDISDFAKAYLVDKNQNGGKYNEFYTTIKYLFT